MGQQSLTDGSQSFKGSCLLHGKIRLLKKTCIGDKHYPSIHAISDLTNESLIHSFIQLVFSGCPVYARHSSEASEKIKKKKAQFLPLRGTQSSESDRMLKTAKIH